jgi:RNA polymerase sigma-70 factor (ECF subfamily)
MHGGALGDIKNPEMKNGGTSVKHQEFQKEAVPHMDILYNYALRMTSNPDDANDLVQETYMKAYRFWDKYEKGTNIRAWLFRIMKNSYINRYRKEVKEPETVDYADIQNFYNTIRYEASDSNDLQEKIFGGLLEDEVARSIESLPEDFRTVVILCDIEGLSYEEIAEFVDCPVGTVRSRLHRGERYCAHNSSGMQKNGGTGKNENRTKNDRLGESCCLL